MQSVTYVAGASGSGKSTRSRELVRELEAAGADVYLLATDVVRAQLRAVLDRSAHADLWAESFDVPIAPGDEGSTRVAADGSVVNVAGFERQCAPVLACVEAGVEYALSEGWSCVVEGVHLVPGSYRVADVPGVQVRAELCRVASPDAHRGMFTARDAASRGGRPAAHYHANLPRIEQIAAFLDARWQSWDTPSQVERAVRVAAV